MTARSGGPSPTPVRAGAPTPRGSGERVNDFAFKIGTVNGTGSASANSLLMQAIFRMGVPVTGKNVFPSTNWRAMASPPTMLVSDSTHMPPTGTKRPSATRALRRSHSAG